MAITKEEWESYQPGRVGKKRLTIGGNTKTFETRLIPISKLFYNDKNGRIATAMALYQAEHSEDIPLSELLLRNPNEYNDIVAGFFKNIHYAEKGEIDALNSTMEDIRKKGQQEPGVVLSDGRVIDGNRRFTALRTLYYSDPKAKGKPEFEYFEAVCLPVPAEGDDQGWKEIKRLELDIQFNVDPKRDYSPIDTLIDFYRTTIDPKTRVLKKNEYTASSGMKAGEYDKNERTCRLMFDFLAYIGHPDEYYLLKKWKLDGPFKDLASKVKKDFDSESWLDDKGAIYDYIFASRNSESGDLTREVRKIVISRKNGGSLFRHIKEESEKPVFKESLDIALKEPGTPNGEDALKTVVKGMQSAYRRGSYFEEDIDARAALKTALNAVCDKISPLQGDSGILYALKIATPAARKEVLELIESISRGLVGLEIAVFEIVSSEDKPEAMKKVRESLGVISCQVNEAISALDNPQDDN